MSLKVTSVLARAGIAIRAAAIVALVAGCASELPYSYHLAIRNDAGASRIVVLTKAGPPGAYSSAYDVPADAAMWAEWKDTLHTAEVLILDAECRLVASTRIPQGLERGDPRPNALGMTIEAGSSINVHAGGDIGPSASLASSTTLFSLCPSTTPPMWAP